MTQPEQAAPTARVVEPPRRVGRGDVLAAIGRHLAIPDTEAIDVIMATALAIYLPGDPLWIYVVGPPGGAKTELLRTLTGERVVTISTLTPNTLISGLKGDGEKIDLLPKLDGKLLVVKDFTSILSKKTEDATAIFADFREAYDGYLEKSFGSGVGIKSYHATFGLIAGVTPAIDMYRNVHALLGERFLRINLRSDGRSAVRRASDTEGDEQAMRRELADTVGAFLAGAGEWVEGDVVVEQRQLEQLRALAEVTATLRTPVPRDRRHMVMYPPEPEIGTRLVKQLLRLSKALANWRERLLVNATDYITVRRVALDSIPKHRLGTVAALIEADGWRTTKQVGDAANLATDTTGEVLEDMWMLHIISRYGDRPFQWSMKDDTRDLLALACIDLRAQTPPGTRGDSEQEEPS